MMKTQRINSWLFVFVVVSSSVFAAESEQVDSGRRTANGAEISPSTAQSTGPAVDTSSAPELPRDAAPGVGEPSASPSAVRRPPSTAARSTADRLELDTTVVTGNRELPKVLYIVPWKKADLGDLPAQPFNTLLDEVLMPVDRDVFRREVTYFEAVNERADATQSTSPTRQ